MQHLRRIQYLLLILCSLLLSIKTVKAQDDMTLDVQANVVKVTLDPNAIMTQHWAMPTLLDPAATGDIDFIRIRGGGRIDWLGSHMSPKNFLITADSPFKLLGKRIGAGIIINSQAYDLFRNLQVSAQGSYKLNIKKNTLSLGIQVGYYHSKFKGSELVLYKDSTDKENSNGDGDERENSTVEDETTDSYDTDLPTEDVGAGTIDLGLGVRFEHPKFYVGVSVLHLTNPTLSLKREGETTTDSRYMDGKLPMTLYFDTGGNIGINNSLFTLQPSLLIGTNFSNINAVVEMRATYNKKVTFGVDYRYNRAAGVVAGLILKDFYFGYSWEYDYSYNPKGSTGNHEIVIGYQFKMDMSGKNTFSHRSIRIM